MKKRVSACPQGVRTDHGTLDDRLVVQTLIARPIEKLFNELIFPAECAAENRDNVHGRPFILAALFNPRRE
jgi:hypothetical protein